MTVTAEVLSGALYVRIREAPSAYAESLDDASKYVVDRDAEHRVVGIEVLEPWRQELVDDDALAALAERLHLVNLLPEVQRAVRTALAKHA